MTKDESTDPHEVEVVVDQELEPYKIGTGTDPFNKTLDETKTLGGISPTLKRKMTRDIQKFHRGDGAKSAQLPPNGTVGSAYSAFDVAIPPYNLNYLAEIYEISSPHYAAINAKVSNIVGLGYSWIESGKTQDILERAIEDQSALARARRRLEKAKREMDTWIDSTNEEDTFTETMMKVWTDLEATGNGYIEIGRKVNGDIGYIGHIPSTTTRVRLKRDGFVQIIGKDAVFFRNFGDLKTTDPVGNDRRPNEIIHLKKYSPNNGYYGVPDIISAKNALAGNEFASRFNLDYFEHKAVPRYVIVVTGAKLSDQSEQKVVNFFRTGLKGKNHRTLYIPLPAPDKDGVQAKFEMKPVETGVQDASFINYHKKNRDEILMAHRVPISKVGLAEGVSLAVARDADKTFKEQVCQPSQKILEKKLNRIIKEKTDLFIIKLNELTLTDEDTQSKIDERYLRMQVIVPNEVRSRKGLPGIKGGDKVVDLKPAAAAQVRSQATGNSTRDQQRQANSTDSASSNNTRAPKGEGRQTG